MFSKVELAKKAEFLDKAKVAREERANERQRDISAVKIQVIYLLHYSLCRPIEFHVGVEMRAHSLPIFCCPVENEIK